MTGIKPKIAVVDDDLANLDILCCELCDAYDVYPISHGLCCLTDFLTIMPDLILLGRARSEIAISPTYDALKQHRALKDIPVIMILAAAQKCDEMLSEPYAMDCITKPFDAREVHTKIQRRISAAR